ncbi:hypothetical protein C7M84_010002 [Penaeus vannamei]|uniref:Uncharacterized protein n=1 Tax=Penaeus vannamei TaxID=6689 RepID=A0A3R7M4H7_PENVA|nr:hypothetical protein C7M84_010002 [Penaeus vannamei]
MFCVLFFDLFRVTFSCIFLVTRLVYLFQLFRHSHFLSSSLFLSFSLSVSNILCLSLCLSVSITPILLSLSLNLFTHPFSYFPLFSFLLSLFLYPVYFFPFSPYLSRSLPCPPRPFSSLLLTPLLYNPIPIFLSPFSSAHFLALPLFFSPPHSFALLPPLPLSSSLLHSLPFPSFPFSISLAHFLAPPSSTLLLIFLPCPLPPPSISFPHSFALPPYPFLPPSLPPPPPALPYAACWECQRPASLAKILPPPGSSLSAGERGPVLRRTHKRAWGEGLPRDTGLCVTAGPVTTTAARTRRTGPLPFTGVESGRFICVGRVLLTLLATRMLRRAGQPRLYLRNRDVPSRRPPLGDFSCLQPSLPETINRDGACVNGKTGLRAKLHPSPRGRRGPASPPPEDVTEHPPPLTPPPSFTAILQPLMKLRLSPSLGDKASLSNPLE